jgi:hypothetical protein
VAMVFYDYDMYILVHTSFEALKNVEYSLFRSTTFSLSLSLDILLILQSTRRYIGEP